MAAAAGDRRLSPPASIVFITFVGLQGNLMAALITLAPFPIYPTYALSGGLEDQQIAGIILWVPAGLIYLASTLWTLGQLMSPTTPPSSKPLIGAWRDGPLPEHPNLEQVGHDDATRVELSGGLSWTDPESNRSATQSRLSLHS